MRDGVLQLPNQFGNRQFLGSGNFANGPAVARVGRNVNRLKEDVGARVMSVRDEGHAHPWLDGLVLPADMARGSARAVAEEERSGDRQAEGRQ